MLKATVSIILFAVAQTAVQQHIDASKKAAGTQWSAAADYFCAETPVTNAATDPEVEPTKVFDNLYFFRKQRHVSTVIMEGPANPAR